MTWRWISKKALLLLHGESLAEHGGLAGLRDEGLLDSALNRPLHLQAYANAGAAPDVAALAASYTVGLAKNHPFMDGNKRAAFLATGLFLYLNGYRLNASQADATITILAVASGELSESNFAAWLRRHAVAR
ncbi:MAG: type II toxin-antitoxin system death-on-curing family toxin [Pseudomonadota bacterium]|nr:type II toxin-antitoxin system death-on-curing family toxin [Pseudomonadota bacterium]